VQQKSRRFEPDKFEDQYEAALVDLINTRRSGKPVTAKARPRGENVVPGGCPAAEHPPGVVVAGEASQEAARAAAGQKEMLMPIQGKKGAKETAAKKPASKQRKSA
jgi:DNA end-binding protein Ku